MTETSIEAKNETATIRRLVHCLENCRNTAANILYNKILVEVRSHSEKTTLITKPTNEEIRESIDIVPSDGAISARPEEQDGEHSGSHKWTIVNRASKGKSKRHRVEREKTKSTMKTEKL